MNDLFTKDLWEQIGRDLKGVPLAWWREHKEALIGVGMDEIKQLGSLLQVGETTAAKVMVAGNMTREEFLAYVKGTTAELEEISRRRAALLDALEDLGLRVARIIGGAIVGAL